MAKTKRKKRRPLRREDRPVREQIAIYERALGMLAKEVQETGVKIVAMANELKRIKHVALKGDDDDGE